MNMNDLHQCQMLPFQMDALKKMWMSIVKMISMNVIDNRVWRITEEKKRNRNLHGGEEFSIFIVTFVLIDKRIEFVDELILNGPERSTYSLKLVSSFKYYFILSISGEDTHLFALNHIVKNG